MIEFTIETDIARPVGAVFAYVADPAKLATWQTNTVSAVPEGDGPVGLGTRIREVHRAPGGKEIQSLVEVSEYEPDGVIALRMLEGPVPLNARITFEASESGTLVGFTVQGEPTGAMRFAEGLLRAAVRHQFAGYCETLKHLLEAAE
jgi:uncharacterized protein YndB with AHSA1/START domain